MYICRRHFLKLRISVQTCSSACRLEAQCSAGTIRQCPGTRRPLHTKHQALRQCSTVETVLKQCSSVETVLCSDDKPMSRH